MVASDWTVYRVDVPAASLDLPIVLETTALGAAYLACHAAAGWQDAVRRTLPR